SAGHPCCATMASVRPERTLGAVGAEKCWRLRPRLDGTAQVSVLGIGDCLAVRVMTIGIAMSPARMKARRDFLVTERLKVMSVVAMMASAKVGVAAVKSAHRASVLTAANSRLGSKGPDSLFLSENALKAPKARTPSKLMTRVRFPSPAPTFAPSALRSASRACAGLNRSGLVTDFSDGRRGLALASTKGHEKFSRGATAPPRSVAQWLEHRSPKQADLLAKSTLVL